MSARLRIALDEEALAVAAGDRITALIEASMRERGNVVISLTGGRTPRRLYERLADPASPWMGRIRWHDVHLFWGDERHVPPDHPDSNFGMANQALVSRAPLVPAHVHRMRGELPDAQEAARAYEETLGAGFAAAGRRDATFDVMLLGLGEDAHVASIFPASALLRNDAQHASRRVAAVWAAHVDAWRITLTPPAILDARVILMVVSGAAKADAVHAALEMPEDVMRWPAQLLRAASSRVEWIIDKAAAGSLGLSTLANADA